MAALRELFPDLMSVAAKWRSLGIPLGFTDPELSQIQSDYGGQVSRADHCFTQVLATWKEDPENFNKDTLVGALRVINHRGLADEIQCQGTIIIA